MKSIVLISILFLTLTCYSQDKDLNRKLVKETTPLTYATIVAQAEKEWPGDYKMQLYTTNKECQAFSDYIEFMVTYVKWEDAVKIKIRPVLDECYNQWCRGKWSLCEGIPDKKFACYDADWSMVMYTINKQLDAYIELNK